MDNMFKPSYLIRDQQGVLHLVDVCLTSTQK